MMCVRAAQRPVWLQQEMRAERQRGPVTLGLADRGEEDKLLWEVFHGCGRHH